MCSPLEMCVPPVSLFLLRTATTPANAPLRLLQCLWSFCCCCYGGHHWKTSQKKQDRPIQTDTQLLLLSPPIRLVAIMPLICFFDGTKSEMIVINCLPYQLIKTEVEGYWTEPCN